MDTIPDSTLPVEHEPSPDPDERALFSRLAASMARHRRAVIVVWLVVTFAAAPLAITLTRALSGAGWEAQGSTAQQVRDELRRDFPALGAETPIVVYRQDTPIAEDPAGLQALVAELAAGPRCDVGRRPARHAAGGRADLPGRADRAGPGRAADRRATRTVPRPPASSATTSAG